MKRKNEQGEKVEKKVKIDVPKSVLNKVCTLMIKDKIAEAKALIPLEARHLHLGCSQSDDNSLLHYAAKTASCDMIEYLLAGGADINRRDNNKCHFTGSKTPLHFAIESGNDKCCELLIEKGADIDNACLAIAINKRNVPIIKLLLSKGVRVDTVDRWGSTYLHTVISSGRDDLAKLLLDYKADVDARDQQKRTPLHIATERGHEKCIRLLLDHKAGINARDYQDRSPLHLATIEAIYKLLVDRGADVNALANGKSILRHAYSHRSVPIIKLLLAAGARPDADTLDEARRACNPDKIAELQNNAEIYSLLNH